MTDSDLLAPSRERRLIGGAELGGALRRRRRTIVALAMIGVLAGVLITAAFPGTKSASTTLLLQFPDGTDASQAMPTELTLVTSRAVAESALRALGSHADPQTLLDEYHGAVASNGILRITATGPSGATARRRADAVAAAYLGFRSQLVQQRLNAVVAAQRLQQGNLRVGLENDNTQIATRNQSVASQRASIPGLLFDSQQRLTQIQQIDESIRSDIVDATTEIRTTRVIDAASVDQTSLKKTLALNVISGLLVALVLGVGGTLLAAVVSTRLRRRSDIAAAMRAPVVLSVGRVAPTGWRRVVRRAPKPERPNGDLSRIVGHLERTLTLASTRALVVVSIDSLKVTNYAVRALAHRLRERGQAVSIVIETGGTAPSDEGGPRHADGAVGDPRDIVLVVAVLDPANGAAHLREWGDNAVAIVTAGRTTEAKLVANAMMIRSAAFRLVSVILVGSDPSDDTLGIVVDTRDALPVAVESAGAGVARSRSIIGSTP